MNFLRILLVPRLFRNPGTACLDYAIRNQATLSCSSVKNIFHEIGKGYWEN